MGHCNLRWSEIKTLHDTKLLNKVQQMVKDYYKSMFIGFIQARNHAPYMGPAPFTKGSWGPSKGHPVPAATLLLSASRNRTPGQQRPGTQLQLALHTASTSKDTTAGPSVTFIKLKRNFEKVKVKLSLPSQILPQHRNHPQEGGYRRALLLQEKSPAAQPSSSSLHNCLLAQRPLFSSRLKTEQ